MFKGAWTIIIQYAEDPAEISVSIKETGASKTLLLSGLPEDSDVGMFRLINN